MCRSCWLWGLNLFPLPRQRGCLLGKMERKRGEISLFYFVGDYFASASMDDDVPTASASGRLVCHVGNGAQFYRKQEKPPDFLRSWAVIRGSASNLGSGVQDPAREGPWPPDSVAPVP